MSATINIASVTMPAGEYFVGDPCYSVKDQQWMPWLRAADYENEPRFLLADIKGQPVLGIRTAIGDGQYGGSDGNLYPVDAGLIGVVPVEVALKEPTGVQRVKFERPFECSWDEDEGTITLGDIEIKTDPEDDPEDSWDDDEPEEDEGEEDDDDGDR